MNTETDILNLLEMGDFSDIPLLEEAKDEPRVKLKLYKHLKYILNKNSFYTDYIGDEELEYISSITDNDKMAKAILIISLLDAINNNTVVSIYTIDEILLISGFPTRHDCNTIKDICKLNNESWHKLWVNTYTKM